MPISLSCPSCDRGLKVKDELAGRKIRCPKCSKVITVPADEEEPVAKSRLSEDEDERPRPKQAVRQRDEDEEEEDERPRKKKKKKKKGPGLVRYVVGGVVLAALLVVLVVVLIVKNRPEPVVAEKKKAPEPVAEEPEAPQDPKPQPQAKEQPRSLAQNIRQAALRPERQNELKQIGLFFKEFVDARNGKNPRTVDEFTDSLKVQYPLYVKLLKEKTYILNLKVNMRPGAPTGVIAYDPLIDGAGHQAVRTDLSVSPIPPAELKQLLAQ